MVKLSENNYLKEYDEIQTIINKQQGNPTLLRKF